MSSLYQSLAFGYEAIEGGVDDAQSLCTAALTRHNGPQGSEVPVGDECCATVLRFAQSGVHGLQMIRGCSAWLVLQHGSCLIVVIQEVVYDLQVYQAPSSSTAPASLKCSC